MRERNGPARSAICGASCAIGPLALFNRPVPSPLRELDLDAAPPGAPAPSARQTLRHHTRSTPSVTRASLRIRVFFSVGLPLRWRPGASVSR
jgi:hypothetical protein